MWAILNNSNIVIGCVVGVTYEEARIQAEGNQLVEMTLENSPAQTGDYYNGKHFIKRSN